MNDEQIAGVMKDFHKRNYKRNILPPAGTVSDIFDFLNAKTNKSAADWLDLLLLSGCANSQRERKQIIQAAKKYIKSHPEESIYRE